MNKILHDYVTPDEAAKIVNVSRQYINRLIIDNKLDFIDLCQKTKYLIKKDSIYKMVKKEIKND